MENLIYIHDAGSGELIITNVIGERDEPQDADAYEELAEAVAKKHGLHWGDCSWGGVGNITIDADLMVRLTAAFRSSN